MRRKEDEAWPLRQRHVRPHRADECGTALDDPNKDVLGTFVGLEPGAHCARDQRCQAAGSGAMIRRSVPSPAELAQLEDSALERLALEWRASASRGEKQAYGVAHTLEVELRRRVRGRRTEQLPPPASPPRRWWTFWQA